MKWHNKWSLTNIGGFTFYWVRYVLAALALLWLTLLALVFLQQDIASCPTAKVQRFTESGGQLNYFYSLYVEDHIRLSKKLKNV